MAGKRRTGAARRRKATAKRRDAAAAATKQRNAAAAATKQRNAAAAAVSSSAATSPSSASAASSAAAAAAAARACRSLPRDVLVNIHGRLSLLDRLSFSAVFGASCGDALKPEAPWLFLLGKDREATTVLSLADRRGATLRATVLRGHVVLGSSHGWLATADGCCRIHLVNPVTGVRHALPEITTMGVFLSATRLHWFSVVIRSFLEIRLDGPPPYEGHRWGPEGHGTITFTAGQMRLFFYRKVVLSASPRPGRYAAMLILDRKFGAPAFATAEDAVWRLAASRDGVEDAIHHRGQFYSITYTGIVEAWEHDAAAGMFTSTVVAPCLVNGDDGDGNSSCRRKYLVAVPGGRLMVVIKDSKETEEGYYEIKWTCSFKVHVLEGGEAWKETKDIGEAALFVGMNNSLCVSTRENPELRAGCVYFTNDELGQASRRNRTRYYHYDSDPAVGVYSLKDGTVKTIAALGRQHSFWPQPAWIT